MHEFAQSGGRIIFFRREQDGLYLGSHAGVVMGATAGILVIRGTSGRVTEEPYYLWMAPFSSATRSFLQP